MTTGQSIAVIGIVAAVAIGLIGWVAAPLVARYVRTLGKVECIVKSWDVHRGAFHAKVDRTVAEERHLQVEFKNGKDVPITVSELRVEFYKGGQPLEDGARPGLEFVGDQDRRSPLGPVSIPPHGHEPRTMSVNPGRDDIVEELQKADRAVFVAHFDSVGDERVELTPPW
jgi:hypothetical protein